MLQYIRKVMEFKRGQEEGATAVEYGLMVAAIAAVIVAAVFALGHYVNDSFNSTCHSIASNGATNGNVTACTHS